MATTGLTLGKFAPLHLGHQFMIEKALEVVDTLYVMVYACDELQSVALNKRINWITSLYPQVKIIAAHNGPRETGYTKTIKAAQDKYIIDTLNGINIDYFFSSEPYGEHVSKALDAINYQIDIPRKTVPISATKIRENAFNNKHYLHPIVYQDLIEKVVFLGAPSTGKSTIAKAIAEEFNTVHVDEYGRTFWENNQSDRRLTPEQLLTIAKTHIELENQAIQKVNKYIFIDTNALTTWHFALDYHGTALPELTDLANNCKDRYQHVFLCSDDIPYDNTWDRSGNVKRDEFQRFIKSELIKREIPFVELTGDLNTRIKKVKETLS